jgi:hypothetical protein
MILLVISVCLFFSAPAFAKKSKPPKSICLIPAGTLYPFSMATKKGGTVQLGGDKVSLYTIQGTFTVIIDTFPLTGTGYMVGDDFIFNVYSTGYIAWSIYGSWNIVNETGFVNVFSFNGSNVSEGAVELELYDCDLLSVSPPVPLASMPASEPVGPNDMFE